jgi:hypothetical protein
LLSALRQAPAGSRCTPPRSRLSPVCRASQFGPLSAAFSSWS